MHTYGCPGVEWDPVGSIDLCHAEEWEGGQEASARLHILETGQELNRVGGRLLLRDTRFHLNRHKFSLSHLLYIISKVFVKLKCFKIIFLFLTDKSFKKFNILRDHTKQFLIKNILFGTTKKSNKYLGMDLICYGCTCTFE